MYELTYRGEGTGYETVGHFETLVEVRDLVEREGFTEQVDCEEDASFSVYDETGAWLEGWD